MRYKFIRENRRRYKLSEMLKILHVSRSGYYKSIKSRSSQRKVENANLSKIIAEIFKIHRGRYGSRRIRAELIRDGYIVNRKRVIRIMREKGLVAVQRRKYKATTNSAGNNHICPNLLLNKKRPLKPGGVLASDITYIPSSEGWLYLAVVMDLFTRKVVGYSTSSRINTELVEQALKSAIKQVGSSQIKIFHSDQGIQFSNKSIRVLLKKHRINQSMSRRGNCYDNAAMESFFHSLKVELINKQQYQTRDQAKQAIFEYIEIYYNRKRLHSSIGYNTPEEFENNFILNKNVA